MTINYENVQSVQLVESETMATDLLNMLVCRRQRRRQHPIVSAVKLAARKRNCQISFHVSRVLRNRRIILWYETIFQFIL